MTTEVNQYHAKRDARVWREDGVLISRIPELSREVCVLPMDAMSAVMATLGEVFACELRNYDNAQSPRWVRFYIACAQVITVLRVKGEADGRVLWSAEIDKMPELARKQWDIRCEALRVDKLDMRRERAVICRRVGAVFSSLLAGTPDEEVCRVLESLMFSALVQMAGEELEYVDHIPKLIRDEIPKGRVGDR